MIPFDHEKKYILDSMSIGSEERKHKSKDPPNPLSQPTLRRAHERKSIKGLFYKKKEKSYASLWRAEAALPRWAGLRSRNVAKRPREEEGNFWKFSWKLGL